MMLRPRTASHLLLFCSLCVFIFAAARTTAVLVQAAEQAVVPAAALDEQIAAATTTRVDSSVQCGAAMTDSDCPAEQRLFDRNHVCSDNQCTQEKCCKTSCHSITCEGQYTRKASYDEIFGGDISLTRCCDRNCRVFTNGCYHYGRRFSERANPASIHCPNHRCTKWICCVPNCYWADCPEEQFVYKLSNPKLQLCGLTNNCNIAECCRRHCGSFDCVAHGQAPRTDIASNEIRCQDNDTGCTAQECCVLASTTTTSTSTTSTSTSTTSTSTSTTRSTSSSTTSSSTTSSSTTSSSTTSSSSTSSSTTSSSSTSSSSTTVTNSSTTMTSSTVTSTTVTSTTGTWSTTRSSSTTTSPTATTSTTKTETKTTTTMTTTTTTNMMSDEQSQKVDTNETEEEGLGVDDEDEGVNAADFFGLSGTGSDMGEVGSDVGTVTKSFVGGVVVALIAQFAITQLDDYT